MAAAPSASKVLDSAIKAFLAKIGELDASAVHHELGRRTAFQRLLEDTARPMAGWSFVHEESLKVKGRLIRPDGLFRDEFGHRMGFWEAKDLRDDLDAEARKKIDAGYPTENIVFEDSRRALLYQDGRLAGQFDLTAAIGVEGLLRRFYGHTVRPVEEFKEAIDQFKERVPELGKALAKIIDDARGVDATFRKAFLAFLQICRDAVNPTLREEAVVEMIVQHLLTERIIRKVFDNPEFARKNVIAREIEVVIDALTHASFSRDKFLASLNPFYHAIEGSFALREDFSEKQTFLNTLYERFFQGFAVKAADTHGIVYTPQEIVDFMCQSVADVLQSEFGLELGGPGVTILDPCTGTGNFVVNLLKRISPQHLESAYRERLFANEVMLMPYYIAALNIEHAYAERTGHYEPFEGLCFVDTLDLKEGTVAELKGLFSDANTARVVREYKSPVTVVIGNPPYNAWQLNENDNNKNRVYRRKGKNSFPGVDDEVSATYAKASRATNKNALSDMYVKFFRWATDRLRNRDGIVCFVTNNSFVENLAFDGMRKHLLKDFDAIYHLDMRGNVRQNPTLSGTAYNVFGIQVGVGITLAIRKKALGAKRLMFARLPLDMRRKDKLASLAKSEAVKRVEWETLEPNEKGDWLHARGMETFTDMIPIGSKAIKATKGLADGLIDESVVFLNYGRGIATCRDAQVYANSLGSLRVKINEFAEIYNYEVYRFRKHGGRISPSEFIDHDKSVVMWSEGLKKSLERHLEIQIDEDELRDALYRPYNKSCVHFNKITVERRYQFPWFYPSAKCQVENRIIIITDQGSEKPFMSLVADRIVDLHIVGAGAGSQCFPLLHLLRGRLLPPREHHRLGARPLPKPLQRPGDREVGHLPLRVRGAAPPGVSAEVRGGAQEGAASRAVARRVRDLCPNRSRPGRAARRL